MKKLSVFEITPGMICVEPVMTPTGQLLAPAGTEITQQLLNRMKIYRCEYAVVEDAPVEEAPTSTGRKPKSLAKVLSGAPKEAVIPTSTSLNSIAHSQKLASSSEFRGFQMDYFMLVEDMKVAFDDVINNKKQIDVDAIMKKIDPLFRSRKTILELFEMLAQMKTVTDSIYAHSLNVALVSRMIGRWLKLSQSDLDTLTLAGLFHDIGKLQVPEEVLHKPGSLTDEEFTLVQKHTSYGYEILKGQNIDSRIKRAALMHHERSDGSGYPSSLKEDTIDDFAAIVGIADVYDAMTAARIYRQPLCPFQVIANFEKDGCLKYPPKYILTFLKQIAITYQGNRIILNDGRGGNIVKLNDNELSRPIIQLDSGEWVDLSMQRSLFIAKVS